MKYNIYWIPLLFLFSFLNDNRAQSPTSTNKKYIQNNIKLDFDSLNTWLHKPLPSFSAVTIEGDSVHLSDLKGKRIVLNLWLTKCAPCIWEIPHLNKLKEYYASQNVVFISMTPEDKDTAIKFVREKKFTFPVIANYQKYISQFISSYPETIFVNSKGYIKAIKGSIPINLELAPQDLGAEFDMSEVMDLADFFQIIDELE